MANKPAHTKPLASSYNPSGFVVLPILLLIALVAVVGKVAYDKSHVLGESSLIAQTLDGGTSWSPPPQESQPQQQAPQESAPAPQESQPQQSAPAPQQDSGSQPQQQYQAPQQGSWGGATNPQPGSTGQEGQQQYQPRTAEQQRQYQGEQGQGGQQGQPFQQGQPSAGGPANQTQQPYVPQFSEKQYQEFQKHYEQEAGKYGFQISGSLPPQFLDRQNFPGQRGNEGQGNTGNVGQNQAGNTTFFTTPPIDAFPSIQGKFNVSSTTGGQEVNLNDTNTRIRLWGTQGANSPLTVVRPDGTQVQIDKTALERINAAMKLTTGSEVSQSGDKFSLRRGQVEAETHLPISFNMATKTFTVQTPNGEKELHVLPDAAAQKLIENKVFSELQTSTTTGEEGTTTQQAKVVLTQLDDKPVYEVEGTSKQKFLGFAIVSIPKTVFVSAETGDQVKTQQTFGSQFLDLLSF